MANVDDLVERHLAAARADAHGRSAEVVVHDGPLRQTVLALSAGTELGEHNSPPAASVLVLHGSIRVTALDGEVVLAGQLRVLTHQRHSVVALEDSAFLLTTVTSIPHQAD